MDILFNWYLSGDIKTPNSKVVKILFNNILPVLTSHKSNYDNGSLGGAPKGNQNAKKTTPLVLENNHKTTHLVLENNPKEKEKDKDKEKDKHKDKDKDMDMFSYEAQRLAEIELLKILNK
jgi:hypothetical protein